MPKRTDARIPFCAGGKAATPSSTTQARIYTANVSRQGLCFYSNKALPLGAPIRLELDMGKASDPKRVESIRGKVRWRLNLGEIIAHGIRLSSPLSSHKTPRLLEVARTGHLPKLPRASFPAAPQTSSVGRLTPRERQIADLIGRGYNNRQMAKSLSIARKTVETHRANLYSKFKVHNAVQLLRALEMEGRKPSPRRSGKTHRQK